MSQNCVREEGKAAKLGKEFIMMTLGTALVSIGVYFFKFPNNFSMGGVSGLAVLLGELVHVPRAGRMMAKKASSILLDVRGPERGTRISKSWVRPA